MDNKELLFYILIGPILGISIIGLQLFKDPPIIKWLFFAISLCSIALIILLKDKKY